VSVKKNFFYSSLVSFLNLSFPLITYPYIARVLGAELVGRVYFATSFVYCFILLASLGIPIYGIREIAKVRNNRREMSRIFSELLLINILTTTIAIALYAFTFIFVSKVKQDMLLFAVFGVNIVGNIFSLDWFYGGIEEFRYIAYRGVLVKATSLILLLLFVHKRSDYLIYGLITVIALNGGNIFNIFNAFKYVDISFKNTALRAHIKPIIYVSGIVLTISLYFNFNITLLGFISGDKQVGLFSTAFKVFQAVLVVGSSLSAVLIPRISFYLKNDMIEEYSHHLEKLFQITGMFTIPASIGVFLLSREIVFAFAGPDFAAGAIDLMIIAPVILISGLSSTVCNNIIFPNNKEKFVLYLVLSGAVSSLVLDVILIPHLQSRGASVSFLSAEFILLCFQYYLLRIRKIIDNHLLNFKINYTKFIIASIPMAGALLVFKLFTQNQIIRLIISVPAGALIYIFGLYFLNDQVLKGTLASLFQRFHKDKATRQC